MTPNQSRHPDESQDPAVFTAGLPGAGKVTPPHYNRHLDQLRDGLAMVWALGCEPPIELVPYITYRAVLDDEVDRALTSLVCAIKSRQQVCRRRGHTQWEVTRRAPMVLVWLDNKVAWRPDFAERVATIAKTGRVMAVTLVCVGGPPVICAAT